MIKEYFCIRTEKGYFAGWKRASYIDVNGKKRFSGREPEFNSTIVTAYDSTQTIGDTAEIVKRNLTTRGHQAEILPVFWANGRWQIKDIKTKKHWITNCHNFKDGDTTAEFKYDVNCDVCLEKLFDAWKYGTIENRMINKELQAQPGKEAHDRYISASAQSAIQALRGIVKVDDPFYKILCNRIQSLGIQAYYQGRIDLIDEQIERAKKENKK